MSALVSAADLIDTLQDGTLQIIDATWHLASTGRVGHAEHIAARIPGAGHLDIDRMAARAPAPPGRMFPPPDIFARDMGKLGLRPDAHFVVYDKVGLYSAARVWWMIRAYGHENIRVLDGGLPAWIAAGGPIVSGEPTALPETVWPVREPADVVRSWQQIAENIDSGAAQLVDVRPASAFNGSTDHLYPGVRPGHIPGAINLSQRDLLLPDSRFKPAADLRDVIARHHVALDRPIVASCGSGVTACILALALHEIGALDCAIYDGSWEEWGMRPDLPAVLDSSG